MNNAVVIKSSRHNGLERGVYKSTGERSWRKVIWQDDAFGFNRSAEGERTLVSVIDCIEREFLKFRWTAQRRRHARASHRALSKAGSNGMCGERFSNAFSLSKKGAAKSAPAAIQAGYSDAHAVKCQLTSLTLATRCFLPKKTGRKRWRQIFFPLYDMYRPDRGHIVNEETARVIVRGKMMSLFHSPSTHEKSFEQGDDARVTISAMRIDTIKARFGTDAPRGDTSRILATLVP